MSGSVTIRHGHDIDEQGFIRYDEAALSWKDADVLAGKRLDRRFNYCVIKGKVCTSVTWVGSCSGCFETEDGHPVGRYEWDSKASCHLGSGCKECGYQGKVRSSIWMPLEDISEDEY